MIIEAPCVVSLVWQLEDSRGQLIDELAEPVEFLVGGQDLLPKVEEAILEQETGFQCELHLEPEHAFGEYDASLVFFENTDIFEMEVQPGMQFEGPPAGAATPNMPQEAIYTVTEVYPEHVVLDGNHPLAGMALRLKLVVRDVREASAAEIEAGTVDQPAISVLRSTPGSDTLH